MAEARALVDDWTATPFEDSATALEDLVARIAKAIRRREARVALPVCPFPIEDAVDLPW